MTRSARSTIAVLALLALSAVAIAACGSSDDEATTTPAIDAAAPGAPTATDAWARASAPGQTTGAMYMTLTGADRGDALVSIAVPGDIAGFTELHETVMSADDDSTMEMGDSTMEMGDSTMEMGDSTMEMDGMDHGGGAMTMRQVQEIPVPAGGTVKLEPGGLHVMLMDLPSQLEAGTTFEATLSYASGAQETVQVEVRES